MAGLKVQHEGMAEPSLRKSQTAISGDESQRTPHLHGTEPRFYQSVLSPSFPGVVWLLYYET